MRFGYIVKKTVKAVLITGLLLFSVSSSIWLILLFPPVQTYIVQKLEPLINKEISGSLTIGSIATNLFSRIVINDISCRNSTGGSDSLYIGSLRIRFLLPLLLKKHIAVTSVTASDIYFRFSVSEDGTMHFPLLPVERNETSTVEKGEWPSLPAPWQLSINKLKLREIRGIYLDSSLQQTAVIGRGEILAGIPRIDSILTRVDIRQGSYVSPWWNGVISQLSLGVQITPEQLKVSDLAINSDSSTASGKGSIPLGNNTMWDLSVSVSSFVSAIPALYTAIPDCGRNGHIYADAVWKGTFERPHLLFSLSGDSVTWQGITADSLALDAEYDTGTVLHTALSLYSPYGTIRLTGQAGIDSLFRHPAINRYSITTSMTEFHPEDFFPEQLKIPDILTDAALSGNISMKGTGSTSLPDSVAVSLCAHNATFLNDTLYLTASMNEKSIDCNGSMSADRFSVSGVLTGNMDFKGYAQIQLADIGAIASWFTQEKIIGSTHISAALNGPVFRPGMEVWIASDNLNWRGVQVDSVRSRIEILADTMLLRSAVVKGKVSLAMLCNSYEIDSVAGTCVFSVIGSGNLLRPDLFGRIDGQNIRYRLFAVDSLSTDVALTGLDSAHCSNFTAVFHDRSMRVTGNAFYVLHSNAGEVNTVLSFQAPGKPEKEGGRVSVGGYLQDDSITCDFSIDKLLLDPLSAFIPIDDTLRGTVSSEGSIRGKSTNPLIDVSLSAYTLHYRDFFIPGLSADAEMKDSLCTISAKLSLYDENQTINASAVVPLLPSQAWKIDTADVGRFSFSLRGTGVQLHPFGRYIDSSLTLQGTAHFDLKTVEGDTIPAVHGKIVIACDTLSLPYNELLVTGVKSSAAINGPLLNPEMTIALSGGKQSFNGITLERFGLYAQATRYGITIDSARLFFQDNGKVVLYGMVPFSAADTAFGHEPPLLHYSVIDLPLETVNLFLPDKLFRKGMIRGAGSLTISNGSPAFDGSLVIDDGILEPEEITPRIGPVNAVVDFQRDTIMLSTLHAKWGKGEMTGTGIVVLRKDTIPEISAKFTAANCSWTSPDLYSVTVDSALLLCTTEDGRYPVTGSIALGTTKYSQDIQLTDLIGQLQGTIPSPEKNSDNDFLNRFDFKIALDLQENALVDMNLGYLKLDGQCTVTGTAVKPSYTGELRLTEGYVLYLDRQFTIDEASLYNYNPSLFNPVLNVDAHADVFAVDGDQMENYTILLTLRGDLKEPVLTLRDKSGELNELEVISILTFGQSPGNIGGDAKERLRTFVSQSVLGFGTRRLEQVLGIERIDIQGDPFSSDGNNAARLTIAKRVTPRLMVLYESEIGKMNRPKISVLYRLANHFFISGDGNAEGDAGVDFIFKYSR